jgi:hypothetical protein
VRKWEGRRGEARRQGVEACGSNGSARLVQGWCKAGVLTVYVRLARRQSTWWSSWSTTTRAASRFCTASCPRRSCCPCQVRVALPRSVFPLVSLAAEPFAGAVWSRVPCGTVCPRFRGVLSGEARAARPGYLQARAGRPVAEWPCEV